MAKIVPITLAILFLINSGYAQQYSTATGSEALINEYDGGANTATGYNSQFYTTYGWNNSSHGAFSLFFNQGGGSNSAYGSSAMFNNTFGFDNTAVGFRSMMYSRQGYRNSAIGFESLYNNSPYNTTDGSFNSVIGYRALYNNTIGNYNVAAGDYAGSNNTTGSYNTFIGSNANANAGNYINATAIGKDAIVTSSNMVRFGDANVITIGGMMNWSIVSDKRVKKNFLKNVPGLSFITALNPVSYNYDIDSYHNIIKHPKTKEVNSRNEEIVKLEERAKKEKQLKKYTGLIAQEVQYAADKVGFDFSGIDIPKNDSDAYGLKYAEFVMPLIQSTIELDSLQSELKRDIKSLKEDMLDITNTLLSSSSYLKKTNSEISTSNNSLYKQDFLYKCVPEYFRNQTIISFHLSQSSSGYLISITNSSNQIVKEIKLQSKSGTGKIVFSKGSLPIGDYFVTLKSPTKVFNSRKISIIN